MSVSAYTSNWNFKLIDFNSANWHTDEWDNWNLVDTLLQTQFGDIPFAVAGGTANAITLDFIPNLVIASGLMFSFRVTSNNTSAVTIAIDGTAPIALTVLGAAAQADDLQANTYARVIYDGTSFVLIEPIRRFTKLTITGGAGSGATAGTDADDLILDMGASGGISLLSPNTATVKLAFGDPQDNDIGAITYNHATNIMSFVTGSAYRFDARSTAGIQYDLNGATDLTLREIGTSGVVQLGNASAVTGVFIDIVNGRIGINKAVPVFGLDVFGGGHFTGPVQIDGALTAASFPATSLTGLVPIANGGTNATNITDARTNLGLGPLATVTIAPVANGGTGASDATTARTNLGAAPTVSPAFTGTATYLGSELGFRSLIINNQVGSYTLVNSDRGKVITTTAGVTVPASVFASGDIISIYNNSGSAITIVQDAGTTLRLAGTASSGNRSLAARGVASVICVATNEFVLSGAGAS